MAETYELFAGDKTLIFDRFRRCLRGPARVDWDIIVNSITLDKSTLTTALKELLIEIVGEDAEDNLTDYMERITKPRTLKCRHWIRRIQHMNIYLGQIAGVTKKYSDKRIIRNVIAPNIPSSWKKYFKLKEGHRKDTLQDVLKIIETLEEFDSPQQTTQDNRKSRYERNSKPKKEYNSKRESPSQHPKPDKKKRD